MLKFKTHFLKIIVKINYREAPILKRDTEKQIMFMVTDVRYIRTVKCIYFILKYKFFFI